MRTRLVLYTQLPHVCSHSSWVSSMSLRFTVPLLRVYSSLCTCRNFSRSCSYCSLMYTLACWRFSHLCLCNYYSSARTHTYTHLRTCTCTSVWRLLTVFWVLFWRHTQLIIARPHYAWCKSGLSLSLLVVTLLALTTPTYLYTLLSHLFSFLFFTCDLRHSGGAVKYLPIISLLGLLDCLSYHAVASLLLSCLPCFWWTESRHLPSLLSCTP